MSSIEDLKIPLQEILSATNGFSEANVIARGGFGKVYRGLSEQHGILAIKRWNRFQGQGDREFWMEITVLSAYKHENLVALVGFCQESGEKVIVYKYERNGSLDKFLHNKDLNWELSIQICIDVARGLRYLHDELGPGHRVIHRDIKSSNILLDENSKAKISDFGLSKISLANVLVSLLFSNPCGTRGYVDPEYLDGALTQKSDVFSFGVVLYEVLFKKLVSTIPRLLDNDHFKVEMARHHYENNTLDKMIDPDLRNQMTSASLRTFATIAYKCTMICRDDRPTMRLVVEELEKALHQNKALSQAMHDVYICFNKEENTLSFLHTALRMALETRGLSVYKDNIENSVEESVPLEAIKQSRSSIIVFSRDFAGNSQNLDEAVKIIECLQERKQFVLPIFYTVDISEVREQSGYFGKTLFKFNDNNRIGVWRNALVEAASQGGIIIKEQFQWSDLHDIASTIKDQVWGESNNNKKHFWCPLLDPFLFKNIRKMRSKV